MSSRWFMVLALLLLVGSLTGHVLANARWPEHRWAMVDLGVYRGGGALVAHGGGLHQGLYQAVFTDLNLPFTYPPAAALAFAPMSVVVPGTLKAVMTVVSIAALGLTIWLAWGLLGVPRDRGRLAATGALTAVLLWTEPIQLTLTFGQINLLLMLLIVADLAQRDTRAWKGVGVGIATGVKLTPAIFIVYLLLTRRLRAAGVAAGAFAVTVVTGFLVLPQESMAYWGGVFLASGRVGETVYAGNQSLHGLLARLAGPVADQAPVTLVWCASVIVIGVAGLTLAVAASRSGRELAGIVVCALTGLLASPVSWSHHWVWIAPAAVLLAGAVRRPRPWRRVVAVVAAAAAVFLAWPVDGRPRGLIWYADPEGRHVDALSPLVRFVVENPYVIAGTLVLAAAVAWTVATGGRTWPLGFAPPGVGAPVTAGRHVPRTVRRRVPAARAGEDAVVGPR